MSSFTNAIAARGEAVVMAPLRRAVHHLVARECEAGDTSALCEKPSNSSKVALITVGITAAVFIIGTSSVLIFLHLRRQREEEKEDAIPFELDGEVDDHPTMGKPPRAWQPQGQQRQQQQQQQQPENPFEPERQHQQQPENPFEPGRR